MAYTILKTNANASPPLTAAEIKKRQCDKKQNKSKAVQKQSSSSTQVTQARKDESSKKLQGYSNQQNFQTLVYFLMAGVRGLFITSLDHRTHSLSDCMCFLHQIRQLDLSSQLELEPTKPIWKHLSAYLGELFKPMFQAESTKLSIPKVPTCRKLAEVITHDFLNHWAQTQPESPFLIPHARAIAGPEF